MDSLPLSTIAAIATPPGDGGVAIIRLSGPKAIELANQAFSKNVSTFESHKLYYGSLLDAQKEVLDQGLMVVMQAPNSYTGETVVEFQGHGGHFLSKKILSHFCSLGAELASPGEFTQRAYLNGKMDLAQAEAVQTLIAAKNDYALKWSKEQLKGSLSKKIKRLQDRMIELSAILEAWVDFPEEGLEFMSFDELMTHLSSLKDQMKVMIGTYQDGKALQEGFTLCLMGQPNVGKSSLMNALLRQERALVTPIAGTTRDTLEETFFIEGIPFRIIDTAGIRQTEELVEQLGIERAKQKRELADLVLVVLDASKSLSDQDHEILKEVQEQKHLIVWNKKDLCCETPRLSLGRPEVFVSAKSFEGIEPLQNQIKALLMNQVNLTEEIYLTQERHKFALEEALEHLTKVITALESQTSPEWVTYDLKASLQALSKIIGFDLTESILGEIFSRFCIGK